MNLVDLPPHRRCAAHTLSLINKDLNKPGVSELRGYQKRKASVDAKLGKIWNKVRRSTNARESCTRILGRILQRPNVTCWNSEYDALDDVMKDSEKVNELLLHLRLPTLSGEDMSFAHECMLLLRPLAMALDAL